MPCRGQLVLLSDYRGLSRAVALAAVHDAVGRAVELTGWTGPYVSDATGVRPSPTFLAYAASGRRPADLGRSAYVGATSAGARNAQRAGATAVARPSFSTRSAALTWVTRLLTA